MILTMYFACTREVIQKSFNQHSNKYRDFVQAFGPQLSIFYHLVLVRSISNEKLENLFFSGKIVTSLAYIFTMEKSPSQDYICLLNFYLSTDFQNFCGTFQALTFGTQKDDCWNCFRTR